MKSVAESISDFDGIVYLSCALGMPVTGLIWRNEMDDNKAMDTLLKMLSETEELMCERDALSEVLEQSSIESLSMDDAEMLNAAGVSNYQLFLEKLKKDNLE